MGDNSRVDERDTMFARMARSPGTPEYEDYYSRRPDLKEVDDALRARPDICRPGGLHYDEKIAAETIDWFSRIDAIRPDPQIVAALAAGIREAADPTPILKDALTDLGAVAAGAAPLPKEFVYTVKGRFDENYGVPVELGHEHVLVFLVEMDFRAMSRAPEAETLRESARQYYRAAEISLTVAEAIREAGYGAKSHHDAHYDVILPPLAVLAGLGELGRNNILIADRFGSRVRIGGVSTDLPLAPDAPISLGAASFCEICRKCADNCPSRALSTGAREVERGVSKWPTNVERCHRYWRKAGTDCGICMACCPFSHRNNRFHNLIRWTVRRLPLLHRPLLLMDDLVYGRDWQPR